MLFLESLNTLIGKDESKDLSFSLSLHLSFSSSLCFPPIFPSSVLWYESQFWHSCQKLWSFGTSGPNGERVLQTRQTWRGGWGLEKDRSSPNSLHITLWKGSEGAYHSLSCRLYEHSHTHAYCIMIKVCEILHVIHRTFHLNYLNLLWEMNGKVVKQI